MRKGGNPDEIHKAIEDLNKTAQEIGAKMYQEAAAKQQAESGKKSGHNHGKEDGGDSAGADDNVIDAEFKEKKDDKKKR